MISANVGLKPLVSNPTLDVTNRWFSGGTDLRSNLFYHFAIQKTHRQGEWRMSKRRRSVELDQQTMDAINHQLEAFRMKFGREPGPDDPLFFDPDADEPRPLTEEQIDKIKSQITELAATAEIRPELIYAIRKTGRIVTESNQHLLGREAVDEWNSAVEEYYRLMKEGRIS